MHCNTNSRLYYQLLQANPLAATLSPDASPVTRSDPGPLRKKDGTLSRIRSHRGNVPVLPQTKLCPYCPAKFTRTTHLNRHLRNHTNERLHRCETCNSQFTRSDLLNRHKKSCNNPSSRCRRRSCFACMESKNKCDRRVPCSRCFSTETDCIYGPPVRRGPDDNCTASYGSIIPLHETEHNNTLSISNTPSPRTPSHLHSVSSSTPSYSNDPTVTSDASSSSASAHTLELLQRAQTHGIDYTQGSQSPKGYQEKAGLMGPPVEPFVQALLSAPILSDYCLNQYAGGYLTGYPVEDSSPTSCPTADDQFVPLSNPLSPTCRNGSIFLPLFTSDLPNVRSHSGLTEVTLSVDEFNVKDYFPEDFTPLAPRRPPGYSSPAAHNSVSSIHAYHADPYVTFEAGRGQTRLRDISPDPTPTELQQYLHMFYTAFLIQIPIFHVPTFRAGTKSPVLLGAMQACGALFIENKRASNFISRTLTYARETLVYDFAWKSSEPMDQIQLILAVVLLQTIGLFHKDKNQRASSNIYHGMLVMMIRQAGLISRNADWSPRHLDESNLEESWLDWAGHEMAKRAILWSFMHDCCHCIYFALPSSYHSHEVTLNLPCENSLWQANTAAEWYTILQHLSLDGSSQASRLTGVSIPKMMDYLSEMRTTPAAVPLSDFAHFVLIHIFLKQLFQHCIGGRLTTLDSVAEGDETNLELLAVQFAMHNWLHNWKNCLDSQAAAGSSKAPFVKNLLPFYWLGQIAIVTYQGGLPLFGTNACNNLNAEFRFHLVKRWLRHIRRFLRNQNESTTLHWHELMQLHLHPWQQVDPQEEVGAGVLEFFVDSV